MTVLPLESIIDHVDMRDPYVWFMAVGYKAINYNNMTLFMIYTDGIVRLHLYIILLLHANWYESSQYLV